MQKNYRKECNHYWAGGWKNSTCSGIAPTKITYQCALCGKLKDFPLNTKVEYGKVIKDESWN